MIPSGSGKDRALGASGWEGLSPCGRSGIIGPSFLLEQNNYNLPEDLNSLKAMQKSADNPWGSRRAARKRAGLVCSTKGCCSERLDGRDTVGMGDGAQCTWGLEACSPLHSAGTVH